MLGGSFNTAWQSRAICKLNVESWVDVVHVDMQFQLWLLQQLLLELNVC